MNISGLGVSGSTFRYQREGGVRFLGAAQKFLIMFFGTTPQIISQYILQRIKEVPHERVIVPFAGNFVVEQLSKLANPETPVICTDVSLYSRLIGYSVNGIQSDIKVTDKFKNEFPSFSGDSPEEKAAAVIFFSEIGKMYFSQHIKYNEAAIRLCREKQEDFKKQIVGKLEKLYSVLKVGKFDFLGTDGVPLVYSATGGDLVFYDPPVLLGDYEKMFAPLKEIFEFDEPDYTEMTADVKKANLDYLIENDIPFFYRTNNPIDLPDGTKEVFRFQYKPNGIYCIYTNLNDCGTFVGSVDPIKEEEKNYPIIGREDVITEKSKVQFVKSKGTVANHYRLLWVKKAQMSNGGTPYLIFVDGKLIGLVQLMSGMAYISPFAVILSDPAAPTSRYKRLSKLILNLVCTEEILDMFNMETVWEHVGFTTRVFTNEPVSMKYRGMFDLVERKDGKDRGHFKYCLIYQNKRKLFKTVKDGLIKWVQKDSKHEK